MIRLCVEVTIDLTLKEEYLAINGFSTKGAVHIISMANAVLGNGN